MDFVVFKWVWPRNEKKTDFEEIFKIFILIEIVVKYFHLNGEFLFILYNNFKKHPIF